MKLISIVFSLLILPYGALGAPQGSEAQAAAQLPLGGVHTHGATSRKSLNFGPSPRRSAGSLVAGANALLARFNADLPAFATQLAPAGSPDSLARAVALAFASELHPGLDFVVTDAYPTAHNGLYHVYLMQQHEGHPVANGNVNLNVDMDEMRILSYASSAEDSAARAVHVSEALRPEEAISAFLALHAPELAPAALDTVTYRDGFLHDVPTAVRPVKTDTVFVNAGSVLRRAYKFELETRDNAYEAYVDSHDAEVLMSVDWVRDADGGDHAGLADTGGSTAAAEIFHAIVGQSHRDLHISDSLRDALRESIREALTQGEAITEELVNDLSRALNEAGTFWRDDAAPVPPKKGKKDKKAPLAPVYRVFPWGTNAPDEGKRETLVTNKTLLIHPDASPAGWHTIPSDTRASVEYLDTRGNNVFAQDNPDGGNSFEYNYRPSGGKNKVFDFKLGWPKAGESLDPASYINASVSQLFYTSNLIHDLYHVYGFDEAAGNFQEYNFGRGGLGGDAVQANAQDGSGMNNANFMTPPDGQRPRMRMYSWSGVQPYRDGDFEAGIVIHEYSHGLSTRLTGGPANSGCLGWGEAGGMGEGWGDFIATLVRMTPAYHNRSAEFSMGEWASARKHGIRNYLYSTNATVNLDTYKTLDSGGYWGVHAIGEVWAEMLYEVAQNLIDKHGFNADGLFPHTSSDFYKTSSTKKKVPKHGNTLALQLVIDAMKIQPCRPSFFEARDAILQADVALTGGENYCAIYKGFAKRGLGPQAKLEGSTPWGGGIRTEDTKLPAKCSK